MVPLLMQRAEEEAQQLRDETDREIARLEAEARAPDSEYADEVDEPLPHPGRRDYVAKEDEARHLGRDGDGRPFLRLVHAGDRLAIWSPIDGGALLNPKGPGLRTLGLATTYARGSSYYTAAYRGADLRPGQPVELCREPDNAHDRNAIALHAPKASKPFGYVQKGRAPGLAKRMDAGETLAAVSLRGPRAGRADDTTVVLVGSSEDVRSMLGGAATQ